MFASKAFDKISKKSTQAGDEFSNDKNMTVFDEKAIQNIKNMACLR
jgi:hypothetical protein